MNSGPWIFASTLLAIISVIIIVRKFFPRGLIIHVTNELPRDEDENPEWLDDQRKRREKKYPRKERNDE